MSKQTSADKLYLKVDKARGLGHTWHSLPIQRIAKENGFSNAESMRTHIRRYSEAYRVSHTSQPLPREVYTGDVPKHAHVPLYTGALQLEGDFIVVGDVHMPTTDWKLLDMLLSVAKNHLEYPRKLCIIGDLINADVASHYDADAPSPSYIIEQAETYKWFSRVGDVFDEIYYSMGNHERRILKRNQGDFGKESFKWMLAHEHAPKVEISFYGYMLLTSGGHLWRATHQRNYSRNKQTVGNKLATLNECNIIAHHQHHVSTGRNESNKYTIIDNGGLHNWREMAYVALDDSTSPVMNNGFTLLKNGVGNLITPYPTMTDFEQWGLSYD